LARKPKNSLYIPSQEQKSVVRGWQPKIRRNVVRHRITDGAEILSVLHPK
jgi:hypothetical protein